MTEGFLRVGLLGSGGGLSLLVVQDFGEEEWMWRFRSVVVLRKGE